MSDFSHPFNDEDGVKGLWPKPHGPRDELVFKRIQKRRARHVALAREWRAAAEADGWEFRPTYQTESVDRAWRGEREGFTIQGLSRPGDEKHAGTGSIHVWGPDGLAVRTPLEYSMDALRAGVRVCHRCEATDVDTQRVGFAGRVCGVCLPDARREVETPGWNN